MSEFPVQSIVEQAVQKQTNALVGNNDVNLNTIVKMSLMDEMNQVDNDEIKSILNKIREANKAEHFWIEKEYALTYDTAGNLVPINFSEHNTNAEGQTDITSIHDEPEGSKTKIE